MPAEPGRGGAGREGFAVRRRTVADREYPPGYVTGQTPAAGEAAPGGSTVVITVASPPRAASDVPDVLGEARGAAEEAIKGDGFQVEVVVEPESDAERAAARPGAVWKQSPAAPGPADRGSTITIWVNPG